MHTMSNWLTSTVFSKSVHHVTQEFHLKSTFFWVIRLLRFYVCIVHLKCENKAPVFGWSHLYSSHRIALLPFLLSLVGLEGNAAALPCRQQVSGLIVRAKGRSYSTSEALTQWLVPPSHLTFTYCTVHLLPPGVSTEDTPYPHYDLFHPPAPVGFWIRPSPCHFPLTYFCWLHKSLHCQMMSISNNVWQIFVLKKMFVTRDYLPQITM